MKKQWLTSVPEGTAGRRRGSMPDALAPLRLSTNVRRDLRSHATYASKLFAVAALSILAIIGCVAEMAPTSQLAHLLKTNLPCRVQLQPAWTGNSKPTVRTGFFTNASPPQLDRLQRNLRFDWFENSDKPSQFHYGPQTISRSAGGEGETDIHTYRTSLPTDAAIRACTTISALTNVLGTSQGFHDGAPSSAGWSFFTLTSSNTIETLSIFCIRDTPNSEIDSLQIRRGSARQTR